MSNNIRSYCSSLALLFALAFPLVAFLAPDVSLAQEKETSDPMARQARQIVFPTLEGETDQAQQPFATTGQMAAQSEQPLAVVTEGI